MKYKLIESIALLAISISLVACSSKVVEESKKTENKTTIEATLVPIKSVEPTKVDTAESSNTFTPMPKSTEKPVVISTPKSTPTQVVTPTPKSTEKPVVTPTPKSTAKPVVTPTPKSTAKPVVTPMPKSTAKPVETPIPQQKIIDTLPLSDSRQAIIIKVPYTYSVHGTCEVYSKDAGSWKLCWSFPCVVGQKGVSANRHEGDMTTPEGIFGFLFEFGSASNPGTPMQYIQTAPGDYWSSLKNAAEYNTWIKDPSVSKANNNNYENLYTQPLYKYAAALDFNYGASKVIGKGSAMFLHITPYGGGGTEGCIALSESNLLTVLKWLNPSYNPRICIGTSEYLSNLK